VRPIGVRRGLRVSTRRLDASFSRARRDDARNRRASRTARVTRAPREPYHPTSKFAGFVFFITSLRIFFIYAPEPTLITRARVIK